MSNFKNYMPLLSFVPVFAGLWTSTYILVFRIQIKGVLGSCSTYNRSIKGHLMCRCVDSMQLATAAQSIDDGNFNAIYDALVESNKMCMTVSSVLYAHVDAYRCICV